MRKLKLDPEALRVESFAAAVEPDAAAGTVHANSFVTDNPYVGPCSGEATQNCQPTDHHLYSCGVSCVDMCFPTGTDPGCYD